MTSVTRAERLAEGMASTSAKSIAQKNKVKQGVSWGVGGAVLATSAAIGSESSPIPQGTSSYVVVHTASAGPDQALGAGSKSLPGATGGGGGGTVGGQGAKPPHYLDTIAKRSAYLATILAKQCPGYFLVGSCDNGHRWAKELYCGREWCEVCGAEWSAAHQRRFARWVGKTTQIESLGYFVFTIPEALRAEYRTKKALADLGHWVQELLKSYGYSRGLRRWHFFGDKSTKWNPHLNIIVDGHYINEGKLNVIKAAYASLLGADLADVNYQYRRSPGKMVHTLKYVTRATFLDYHWDPDMALELHGFRNQLWWGSKLWNDEPAWSLDDLEGPTREDIGELDARAVESLESGNCPECGLPITWSKPVVIAVLGALERRSLGAGYWALETGRPPPPDLPAEVRQRLYCLELIHRVEVRQAVARAEAEAKAEAEEYQGWWAQLALGDNQ
ncbi:hypothetical protein ES703_60354 [subsurface metagenome]